MSINNIIAGSRKAASRYFFFLMAFAGIISMTSCSENDDTEDEYENWAEKNETYFNNIYAKAEAAINSGDDSWKIIRTYSKDSISAKAKTDFIVAHVETIGTGTESPIYTDTVRIHYRGRLIPTKSYPDGKQFDTSWTGEYNLKTMRPSGAYASNYESGRTTALMNMHMGDRWTVYIPYTLGYGVSANTTYGIRGYSTLIYDLTLVDFKRKGEKFPDFQ